MTRVCGSIFHSHGEEITGVSTVKYTDKKENEIFLIYKEIQMDQLQSHI
jgi:hypothetical protein